MRYNRIKTCDTQNSDGLCVSLWVQGCPHRCEGCWNPDTWDNKNGILFTEREVEYILEQMSYGQNLSILGGEPLVQENINELTMLCRTAKVLYPKRKIWIWTGYNYDEVKHYEVLKYVDYLIDGKYEKDKNVDYRKTRNKEDKYRGSSNQNIIKLNERRKTNESN